MTNTDDLRWIGAIAFISAVLLMAGGCQNDPTGGHNEAFFPGEGPARSSSRIAHAQSASGARADATLRGYHFDGDALNSLGRQKLELMLADDDSIDPLTVYIDVDDSVMVARSETVAEYLRDKGLSDEQMKFESGENPENFSPVAPNLARMSKTESGTADGAARAGGANRGAGGAAADNDDAGEGMSNSSSWR